MPETVLLRTLKDLKDQLETATAKFDEASGRMEGYVNIIRRLRVFFWLFAVGAIVVAVIFGLVYRESQLRVDQIQESRLAGCVATEKAKAALVARDVELVNIAVEVAEGDPETGQAILNQLDNAPSAAALEPLNCRDVIGDE